MGDAVPWVRFEYEDQAAFVTGVATELEPEAFERSHHALLVGLPRRGNSQINDRLGCEPRHRCRSDMLDRYGVASQRCPDLVDQGLR